MTIRSMRPNETELSHRWRGRGKLQVDGCAADNIINRLGGVGSIAWLGRGYGFATLTCAATTRHTPLCRTQTSNTHSSRSTKR